MLRWHFFNNPNLFLQFLSKLSFLYLSKFHISFENSRCPCSSSRIFSCIVVSLRTIIFILEWKNRVEHWILFVSKFQIPKQLIKESDIRRIILELNTKCNIWTNLQLIQEMILKGKYQSSTINHTWEEISNIETISTEISIWIKKNSGITLNFTWK